MAASDAQLLAPLLAYAQPSTYPTIRRSEYLADALQRLSESGGQNLRSPTALWGNLAAQALLQRGRDKNFKELSKAAVGDMSAMASALGGGLPGFSGGGSGAGPVGTPPIAGGSQIPPQTQGAPMQSGGGIPMQQVSPQAVQQAQAWIQSGNPMLMKQGIDQLMKLRQQSVTPVPLSPGHMFNSDGSVKDLENNYIDLQGASPADALQMNTVNGEKKHQAVPGVQGPNGTFLQSGQNNIPQYVLPPTLAGGKVMPYGPASPSEMGKFVDDAQTSQPVAAYKNIRAKADAVFKGDPNSPYADLRRIETLQESLNGNPTLAVREGLIHEIKDAQGDIAQILGQFNNTFKRQGYLDQTARAQIDRIIADAVQERYEAAQSYLESRRNLRDSLGYPDAAVPNIDPPHEAPPAPPGIPGTAARPAAPAAAKATPKDGVARPKSKAEYDALKPGTPYIDPTGTPRTKK